MTVTINLSPEKEKRLQAIAAQTGVGVEDYVQSLVDASLPMASVSGPRRPTGREQLRRRLHDLPKSHPKASSISNEHLRREHIYEDAPDDPC